jgi:activator of 2-hydroxyglutaryl-CoA dehydratase
MCTVFAESEVISLLAKGADKADIMMGIIESIAARTFALANKITIHDEILFTGGLANSERITLQLEKLLNTNLKKDVNSQFAGALGAAVIGWEELNES